MVDSADDINGQNFNHELYLQRMFKECSLKQIMDRETDIVKDTQTLHSDMQTLVYENYNKFISATDTVRKMKNDFKKMEDEMDLLAKNMESITSNAVQISSTLQDTRTQINKLSGIHTLLKRLQFLFRLPTKLKSKMEEEKYAQAVEDYMHAQRVLQQYGNMPSFQGIQDDCEAIVGELKAKLRKRLEDSDASAKQLTESVELLLQLREPAGELRAEFLSCADKRLGEQLVMLQDQSEHRDIIEFVDLGCSGFLNDLCLVVGSFKEMFGGDSEAEDADGGAAAAAADAQLNAFIAANMRKYFALVRDKVELEQDVGDTVVLVRALDRFHRRLQAMSGALLGGGGGGGGGGHQLDDLFSTGTEIVTDAGKKQCRAHLQSLKVHLADSLARVRQKLATPRAESEGSNSIGDMLTSLIVSVVEKIKGILQDLLVFIQPDVTFALKPRFRESFCVGNVREGLVVGFVRHMTETAGGFCAGSSAADPRCPAALLLLLSKLCLDFRNGSVRYLLSQCEELFGVATPSDTVTITDERVLNDGLQAAAQTLLDHYVRVQGLNVSQMLRKSVETRDWLHTIEPRTVRAVMKRVVEDIAAVDAAVALLYEERGGETAGADRSSDSSRKAHSLGYSQRHQYHPQHLHPAHPHHHHRSATATWSAGHHVDSSMIVSNMHKLFSERIEIFSPVDFDKVSILTGVIKISLKTFLECVRLKTYSRFGLQQIQVDTHYLQLYLWRFVADENLVHFMLDEILGSAVHRCLEPVLMEPSVVEIICERG